MNKKIRNDIILILLLALVALLSYFAMRYYQKASTVDAICIVTKDGEEIGRYPLSEDTEFTVDSGDGSYNTFVIKDGKVDMTEADCPDQICVNHSRIYENGQTIVCLPNKVVIEIVSGSGDKNDTDVDLTSN